MHRYGYYMINSHIDDIWDNTLAFWQKKKCKILNQFTSEDKLYRKLKIKHGKSVHLYGTAMGETYEMIFTYIPEKMVTYIGVEIYFSWFGKGFTWMVPQEMMEKWAKEMGIQPIKLMKEKNPVYLQIFNDLTNMFNQQTTSQTKFFCPICGHENPLIAKFCIECGSNLEV